MTLRDEHEHHCDDDLADETDIAQPGPQSLSVEVQADAYSSQERRRDRLADWLALWFET